MTTQAPEPTNDPPRKSFDRRRGALPAHGAAELSKEALMTPTTADHPAGEPESAAAEADVGAIALLRGQIDALDTALSRLIRERAQLSRRVQTARMNTGGSRVDPSREEAVLDTYRARLGADGAIFAAAVLRVCRGAH
jgi:chorismate mutase